MDKRDDFERFVRDHRADFEEGAGPDPAIWERLDRSLYDPSATTAPVRRLFSMPVRWASVAAAVVLCISLAAFVRTYQVRSEMTNIAIPADLKDAQAYYEQRISGRIAEIKRLSPERGGDSVLWQAFARRDEEYERLSRALRENPGDPHVKAAFVEFYRSRLEVLTRIASQLETYKNDVNLMTDSLAYKK